MGQALLLVPLIVATRLYFRVHTMGALELMVAFACLAFLFNIAVMLPMLSVGVRRMHDTGNAGFLHFVPVVNFMILLLPSEKTSEYRSGYNIHPVRNALGKAIFVFTLVSYALYMGTIISNAVLLSLNSVWNYASPSDSDSDLWDDDYDDFWLYDDDDDTEDDAFADFPDELPPVSQERLAEILAEIVARESRIVTEEESDTAIVADDCVYLHAVGNTYCVVPNGTSPYSYERIVNPAPSDQPHGLLMVLYGRPTKENMLEYTDGAAKTETQYAERKLAFGVDDYEEAYETVENFTITWNPTVTIGGIAYEVIFTDIDDD